MLKDIHFFYEDTVIQFRSLQDVWKKCCRGPQKQRKSQQAKPFLVCQKKARGQKKKRSAQMQHASPDNRQQSVQILSPVCFLACRKRHLAMLRSSNANTKPISPGSNKERFTLKAR